MRLLLVEDDALLGDGIATGLGQLGFAVDWVRDGVAAEHALAAEDYSALVLDLGLPKKDGLAVLTSLRERGASTPVLILTARDTVNDRITGLDAGADDYLVKPFDLGELAARLRALIRRSGGSASTELRCGRISLDPASRSVSFDGAPVALSAREFDLLHVFLHRPGQVLSREQLESQLYAWGKEVESNAVEVHLHHLRKKLAPDLIRTVRGVGYVLPKGGA